MTDWERVERLRAKGLGWEEIAGDPKVGFTPPEGAGRPGLALKGLYFQRRSRSKRQGKGSSEDGPGGKRDASGEPKGWTRKRVVRVVAFVGILLALTAAVPLLASLGSSLIFAVVPSIALIAVAVVGLGLAGASFIIGSGKALALWKGALIAGIILGVATAGIIASVSLSEGCPNLSTTKHGEPGPAGDTGWVRVGNPLWTQNNQPVVFFLGSIACPYCSASSWAVNGAVRNFSSSFSGTVWGTSNPNDVYPNTPEVELSGSVSQGPYITWQVFEGTDPTQITVPSPGCPQSAYEVAYNTSGGIPFVVIGGIFVHTGSLVSPSALSPSGTPESPNTVAGDLQSCGTNPSGAADCAAILPAQFWLEAYMAKADQLAGIPIPSAVSTNSQVSADLQAIT